MKLGTGIPREHGFWVMLCAAVLSSIGGAPATGRAALAALVIAVAAVVAGGASRRWIRRHAHGQLGASALLAWTGFPVSLAGGVEWTGACLGSLSWMAIFVSGSLLVRAAFARATRDVSSMRLLQATALALTSVGALVFALLGAPAAAISNALASALAIGVIAARPTTKHLKPVGLALAGTNAVAVVLMIAV